MQIHSFASEKYINLSTNVVSRQCGEDVRCDLVDLEPGVRDRNVLKLRVFRPGQLLAPRRFLRCHLAARKACAAANRRSENMNSDLSEDRHAGTIANVVDPSA
jgi:hypothetical protein